MSHKHGLSEGEADHGRRILTWAPELDDDFEPEREPDPEPAAGVANGNAAEPAHAEAPRANGLAASGAAPRVVRPTVAAETEQAESQKRKRGRPKGRAVRRQVHFHVDPHEEELLQAAVTQYGSQQKGLIAALVSLQETELLHDEIARLRDECERQRRLLDEAQQLFRR
jgi:hypothetical protein